MMARLDVNTTMFTTSVIYSNESSFQGLAHLNSPVGLAAHILEKFAVTTDPSFLDLDDGGFGRRIPIDHVLTNLMVYYVSRSAPSSYRFYKENFLSGATYRLFEYVLKIRNCDMAFLEDAASSPRSDCERNIIKHVGSIAAHV